MMRVRARFLAVPPGMLKQRQFEVEVPSGTTVGELINRLAEETTSLAPFARFTSATVNRAYVGMQTELHDGDEVVSSPPVGGG